ncbi:MAG TPA: hypothetical protein VMT16_01180, partial [Thermoanaerobaculia bacterium]|nr:hypothetical protein [Thermoanaerobaculia bacterium]
VTLRLAADPERTAARARGLVELAFRLAGLPEDNPFVHHLMVDFADHDGEWLVTSLAAAPGSSLPFWSEPGLERLLTEHFIAYSRKGTSLQLLDIVQQAEIAYEHLRQLRLPLAPRYLVHAVPARRFQELAGTPQAIGLAMARYALVDGRMRVDSRAMFLNGALFDEAGRWRFTYDARDETLRHELVHLAFYDRTRPLTPQWLVEGVAEYFSGAVSPAATQALGRALAGGAPGLSLARLSGARSLAHGGGAEAQYLFAGHAVAFLVERFGMAGLVRFYDGFTALDHDPALSLRLERRPLRGGPGAYDQTARRQATAEVARETLGVELAALDRELGEWIRAAPLR